MTHTRIDTASLAGVFLAHALFMSVVARSAHAQWTVISLCPPDASDSVAYNMAHGQQVGRILIGALEHASLWNGSADPWIDLNPTGALESTARGIWGEEQVGYATFSGGLTHAGLWHGTAGSWVDLQPAQALESRAHDVFEEQQVGYARIGGFNHASLWGGTAESWVDLHPEIATESLAFDIYADEQVGYARIGAINHASLWHGSAASWIDLSPARAVSGSAAYGVANGRQVGMVNVSGDIPHASLWSGSADSWMDLNPVTALASVALGISGDYQVGNALVGDIDRASLWSGSADSWVDLHAVLPSGFSNSVALGVAIDEQFMYVTGFGYNAARQREEALLWARPVPGPCAIAIFGLAGLASARRRR